MKLLEKRIGKMEKAWLPRKLPKSGILQFTWEEYKFTHHLYVAYPDIDKMPKFLRVDYDRLQDAYKRGSKGKETVGCVPERDPKRHFEES